MTDEEFLKEYELLLSKDYCNCNEMNCIDNNAPRKILNIAKEFKEKQEQKSKVIEEAIKQTNILDERLQKYVSAIPFKEVGDLRDILNKGVDE